MIASASLNFDDQIVYLSVLNEDIIAIADKTKKFSLINSSTMETLYSKVLKHAYAHAEKKSISFSPDGRYLAYTEDKQSVVRVIDIQKQKLHHSFPTLQNKIETLCFDPTSAYLVAGSVTGRVFLWNLFLTGQISRLSSFPEYTTSLLPPSKINYVCSICFSPSGNLVATSGYGGSIVITNIHTEVLPKRISPNRVRINALQFIDENTLCAGNVEGGLDIIDIKSAQIIKHIQTSLADINSMCLSSSKDFLFISGHTKQVSLFDLQKLDLVDNEYIRVHSKISHIEITSKDVLIVGCVNGSLHTYTLYPDALFKTRIETASYMQAYDMLHKFPLLKHSSIANDLHDIWESTFSEAILLAEEAKFEKADTLLKKFSNIPSLVTHINEFQGLITFHKRFYAAVENKNYALAYSISDHVPLLKRTKAYSNIEEIWDTAFRKAQACIIKHKTEPLFTILEPFNRVSSKLCFIQILLHRPEQLLEFIRHINDHSYEKIFTITKQFPCLKEISSYQKVIKSSQELLLSFKQHIYSGDYKIAKLEEQDLTHISYLREELKEYSPLLELSKKLENFSKQDDLFACFTLIDSHTQLQELPLTKKLEDIWMKKMQHAEQAALLGDTKEIKHILKELLALNSRASKIGTLLRLSYMTQIKLLVIKEQDTLVTQAVNNYIDLFGYDTELHNLLKKIKQSKDMDIELSSDQEHRRPRGLWLVKTSGNIPNTILDKREVS